MLIAGAVVLLILAVYGGMIFVRKIMWDAVHRNLLDLEEQYEGKVIRRNFAARPVFYGKLCGEAITVNFSSERREGKRLNYIDVSLELKSLQAFTISDMEWAKNQGASPDAEFEELFNETGRKFLFRPAFDPDVNRLVKNPATQNILDQFTGLAYIYAGKSGILCEYSTEDLIKSTEYGTLKPRLEMLAVFGKLIST